MPLTHPVPKGLHLFVRRLGQAHLVEHDAPTALCDMPLLSHNYAENFAEEDLEPCNKCWAWYIHAKDLELAVAEESGELDRVEAFEPYTPQQHKDKAEALGRMKMAAAIP